MNNIIKATFYSNFYDSPTQKLFKAEGTIYFAKRFTEDIFYLNEYIGIFIANKIKLNTPKLQFLSYNGDLYIGTVFIEDRLDLGRKQVKIRDTLITCFNLNQCIKCCLLDLYLMNSDRYYWNVLEKDNSLFFIDFDKSLFANGTTDLHRFDRSDYPNRFDSFLVDYLAYSYLNYEVFTHENLISIIENNKLFSNIENYYNESLLEVKAIIDINIDYDDCKKSLLLWWDYLQKFFKSSNLDKLVCLLKKRDKYKEQV